MKRFSTREPATFGERAASFMSQHVGSWKFIIGQSLILVAWMAANTLVWFHHWDPKPFILLNLMLSFQAAYTGPILLIAANRLSAIDRARDEMEATEVDELRDMNRLQLDILRLIHENLTSRR